MGKCCKSDAGSVCLAAGFSVQGIETLLLAGEAEELVTVIGRKWWLVSDRIWVSMGDSIKSFKCIPSLKCKGMEQDSAIKVIW